jgi:hypothetical protein
MSRPLRLAGATAVLLSLWMPWYAIHVPGALRDEIGARAGALPQGMAAFAQGLLAALPPVIDVTGWQAFGGADVAMAVLAGGVALLCFAVADRSLSVAAAGALGLLVLVHLFSRPGPAGIASLRFGAWVAMAGAVLAVAGALMSDGEHTPEPTPAWMAVGDAPPSVAPPG